MPDTQSPASYDPERIEKIRAMCNRCVDSQDDLSGEFDCALQAPTSRTKSTKVCMNLWLSFASPKAYASVQTSDAFLDAAIAATPPAQEGV